MKALCKYIEMAQDKNNSQIFKALSVRWQTQNLIEKFPVVQDGVKYVL